MKGLYENILFHNRLFDKLYDIKYCTLFVEGNALEDQCASKPCQNGGECIQIKYRRYKCDCQGTRFYGKHCEQGKQICDVNIEVQSDIS